MCSTTVIAQIRRTIPHKTDDNTIAHRGALLPCNINAIPQSTKQTAVLGIIGDVSPIARKAGMSAAQPARTDPPIMIVATAAIRGRYSKYLTNL